LTATRFAYDTHPLAKIFLGLAAPIVVSAEKGAQGLVHLCSSAAVDGVSGRFFYATADTALAPAATNDEDARRLWELSASLTRLGA
jgi:hypothetical protein